jgi:hypothetical protein
MAISGINSQATDRVRRHRATAGLIRVEVEVPTPEDALAVRGFAQARRRIADRASAIHEALPETATTGEALEAFLAALDGARRDVVMQFGQALAQATDPDMLARGRRVALNFADAVTQRRQDMALRVSNDSQ